MKIRQIRSWKEPVALTRPYSIAGRRIEAVDLFYVEVRAEGAAGDVVGLGSASPSAAVTGETAEACARALSDADALLRGDDLRHMGRLQQRLADSLAATPGARAAVDMALWDAFGRHLGVPLVDLWGCRRAEPIATSITVGIQSIEQALADAEEYLDRGFRCLKIKIGDDFDDDVARLVALRSLMDRKGGGVSIRVDGNRGMNLDELRNLASRAGEFGLELIEQPLPVAGDEELATLPDEVKDLLAADESLVAEQHTLALLAELPFHHWNLKLMKHGGPTPARAIAHLADLAGLGLMWGCMDESVVSIAAALHAAYASPATRRLDLDGSFDLAADLAVGGFRLEDGRLHVLDEPGLGVRWLEG